MKENTTRNVIILCVVIVLIAAAVVIAVSPWKKADEGKKLTIAMEGTWMPWTYHGEDGKLTGFDYEVGMAIAEKLGMKAEFKECPWDSIFAGIDAGRYDIAINGVDWTEERSKSLTLSDPYVYNYPVLIIREGNEDIKGFSDLDGKKTANTVSSTYAQLAESFGATNQGVDDLSDIARREGIPVREVTL